MVDLEVCKKPYGWIPTVVSTYVYSFTNQIQSKMRYGDMLIASGLTKIRHGDMLIASGLTKMRHGDMLIAAELTKMWYGDSQ